MIDQSTNSWPTVVLPSERPNRPDVLWSVHHFMLWPVTNTTASRGHCCDFSLGGWYPSLQYSAGYMTSFLCWHHSWHDAFHSNSTRNMHSETNGALTQSTVTRLKFTLRHQQLGHKASTGNGLWSIAVQRVSLYTVNLHLKQHCNLKDTVFIVLVHINTVAL